MSMIQKRPLLSVLVAFIAGLIIGLPVLGWWLWPVEWTDATPAELADDYQQQYVRTVAELYSFNGNTAMVQSALAAWGGQRVACEMAQTSADPAEQARLQAVATVVNPAGCEAILAAPAEEGGGNILGPTLFLLLLLALLIAAIFYVLNQRSRAVSEPQTREELPATTVTSAPPPAASSTRTVQQVADDEVTAVPIARFRTSYSRGNDAYDDTFSIESQHAEFLGECGVGIAEAIGRDTPRNVTAFEIWLFDKNDIRTITKVIMSDHAFFDDALKAKLAPKGEPVLAREAETIVLETASLIINAEITDMAYGVDSTLPEQSYFDRFTIELSAWAKETDSVVADYPDDIDDQLDF